MKQTLIALVLMASVIAAGCRTMEVYAQDDSDFETTPLCSADGACTPFGPEDTFGKIDREANGG